MSLVGLRLEQVDRYRPDVRAIRLALRPELTGPMQVFGRGELSFDERLAVEREYVENLSLSRDMRILERTLTAVTTARGVF
jgi:lipopolysaccharide/colanic/teichoic acid biosynthesis glycosyltransferase